MNLKEYTKYALTLLFILILYLSYSVLKPFLLIIAAAMIIAYIFYPLYIFLHKKIQKEYLAGSIVIGIILIILTVPLIIILHLLVDQAINVYEYTQEILPETQKLLFENKFIDCTRQASSFICDFYSKTTTILGEDQFTLTVRENIAAITSTISRYSYLTLKTLPTKIVDAGIMFVLVFFFMVDAERIFNAIRLLLPMKLDHETYIIQRLKDTTHAVVFGQIITAIIQGILGGIGFAVFGVSNPVLFGILMIFFALIPVVGTALIWLPAALYMIITGYLQGNYWSWLGDQHSVLGGILLLLWGIFVSTVDNVIKPKLIGDRAKLHPLLVFLGAFGGLKLFGVLGVLLGPILLAVLATFLDILEKENQELVGEGGNIPGSQRKVMQMQKLKKGNSKK